MKKEENKKEEQLQEEQLQEEQLDEVSGGNGWGWCDDVPRA